LVDSRDLFKPLAKTTLDRIPAQYRPNDGHWTGFAGRSTVLVYNPSLVSEADLPTSLLDLADPQWAGKVSFSPTGADFQAIVAAVLALEGEEATKTWLAGIKANGKTYQGNNVVLKSVNAGEVATGIIYHYYWDRDQEESGENSSNSKLYFFGDKDPGAFVSTSGAGVLANGDHVTDAEMFVDYLTSAEGQQIIADSYALEYTLNPEVPLGREVKPFAELEPPAVGVSELDSQKVVQLMQDAGLL
ncbi:MAG: extracellular solute-binding protein, partial [Microbacterium sp.]